MLSDNACKVAGRLAVHGYTPKDGLSIDQLTDYLPDMRRDQLMAVVREVEAQGCVRALLGRSGLARGGHSNRALLSGLGLTRTDFVHCSNNSNDIAVKLLRTNGKRWYAVCMEAPL
jgi:hypothetical protein